MKIGNNLIGPRVFIRNYTPDDLKFSTDMWFDEENGKYLSDPTAENADKQYQKALDSLQNSTLGYYLVVQSRSSGELLGTCCIFRKEKPDTYDIGYCIHKNHWKQGYGTEVVGLLLGWIRDHGGKEVMAEVAVANSASKALLKKFGFEVTRETEFKKYNRNIPQVTCC